MSRSDLHVVFLDRDTLAPEIILPDLDFPHQLTVHARTAADQVATRVRDADIVITNKVRLDAATIDQATRLRMIAVAATGVDNIDLDACAQRDIVVSNIRDYARNTVPEHTFGLIFALRRNIVAYRQSVAQGRWQEAGQFCYFDYPIKDLAGSTLGIIGRGSLGQATAAIGEALGMTVLYAGRKGAAHCDAPYTPFNDVLARSDVISLHCPLNEQTRNLIDTAEFAAMTRKPLLINTARGGLVNDLALTQALRSGQIAGAGVDVTAPEPPPADHPLMTVLDLPNFILTPHVGWASQEAMQGLANQLVENINAFQRGAPRHNVLAERR